MIFVPGAEKKEAGILWVKGSAVGLVLHSSVAGICFTLLLCEKEELLLCAEM